MTVTIPISGLSELLVVSDMDSTSILGVWIWGSFMTGCVLTFYFYKGRREPVQMKMGPAKPGRPLAPTTQGPCLEKRRRLASPLLAVALSKLPILSTFRNIPSLWFPSVSTFNWPILSPTCEKLAMNLQKLYREFATMNVWLIKNTFGI